MMTMSAVMDFEIIPDEHLIAHANGRIPIFTWHDACFDGQLRLVTAIQAKEMGYASLSSVQASFRKAAERRDLRPMAVMVKACRAYPNGGLAVRALAKLPAPSEPLPEPEPNLSAEKVSSGRDLAVRHAERPVPDFKLCACPDHRGANPALASAFRVNSSRVDGLAAWCTDCSTRHYPPTKKRRH